MIKYNPSQVHDVPNYLAQLQRAQYMNLTTATNGFPGHRAAPPADEDGALEDEFGVPGELEHAERGPKDLHSRPRVELRPEVAKDVLVDGAAPVVSEFLFRR